MDSSLKIIPSNFTKCLEINWIDLIIIDQASYPIIELDIHSELPILTLNLVIDSLNSLLLAAATSGKSYVKQLSWAKPGEYSKHYFSLKHLANVLNSATSLFWSIWRIF